MLKLQLNRVVNRICFPLLALETIEYVFFLKYHIVEKHVSMVYSTLKIVGAIRGVVLRDNAT